MGHAAQKIQLKELQRLVPTEDLERFGPDELCLLALPKSFGLLPLAQQLALQSQVLLE